MGFSKSSVPGSHFSKAVSVSKSFVPAAGSHFKKAVSWSQSFVPADGSHFKKAVKGAPGEVDCDPELKNLIGTMVKVDSLSIHGRPLEGRLCFLDHNFLIIDVAYVLRGDTREKEVRYIMAEKDYFIHEEKGAGQIKLSHYTTCADKGKKHYIDLEGCGMIPGEKLLEILETYITSFYSLLKYNCWMYADGTFRRLIEEFANLPDTNSGSKKRLEKYLKELPPLQLPSDAFKWVETAGWVVVIDASKACTYWLVPLIIAALSVIRALHTSDPEGACQLLRHELLLLLKYLPLVSILCICGRHFFIDFLKGIEPGIPRRRWIKKFMTKECEVRGVEYNASYHDPDWWRNNFALEDLKKIGTGLLSISLTGRHLASTNSLSPVLRDATGLHSIFLEGSNSALTDDLIPLLRVARRLLSILFDGSHSGPTQ